jgi:hypothetical protein
MNQRFLLLAVAAAILPAPVLAQGATARDNINALIEEHAKANGLPTHFVHQVVKRESNYNPNAKGGSALGLMQIKHATARGMGYKGDAAGLYDVQTNLRYGIAYLAGAYRTAKGDLIQAYTYYSRGYYYAAKRQGVTTEVADLAPAAAATSSAAFGGLFGLRPAVSDPNVTAANTALAYAPSPVADPALTQLVEVPLPPRRPASLGGEPTAVADAATGASSQPASTQGPAPVAVASAEPPIPEAVEVPLPPRRPSAVQLAAFGRPAVAKRTTAPTVLEASALPAGQ